MQSCTPLTVAEARKFGLANFRNHLGAASAEFNAPMPVNMVRGRKVGIKAMALDLTRYAYSDNRSDGPVENIISADMAVKLAEDLPELTS